MAVYQIQLMLHSLLLIRVDKRNLLLTKIKLTRPMQLEVEEVAIKDEEVSEVVDTEELEVIVADTIIVGTEVDPEIIVEVKREIEATIMMVEVIIMDQDQRLAHMIVTSAENQAI